jgi:hypothetical protein
LDCLTAHIDSGETEHAESSPKLDSADGPVLTIKQAKADIRSSRHNCNALAFADRYDDARATPITTFILQVFATNSNV